jgi:chromosome segregation ATPase
MARKGVTQADVDQAADALVLQGQRPTVERVRGVLGTGSPNTVTPLLDIWFKALGKRIAGVAPAPGEPADGVPLAVRNSVRMIWDTALGEARRLADESIQQERQALEDGLGKVRDQQAALDAARGGLEEAARVANQRAQDLHTQLQDVTGRLQETELQAAGRIQDLQAQLRQAQEALAGARRQLDEQAGQHARERAADGERAASTERRLLLEVDRARGETAAALGQLQEALAAGQAITKKLDAARERQQELMATIGEREGQLAQRTAQLEHARGASGAIQRLADAAAERSAELAAALEASRRTEADLRQQLKQVQNGAAPAPRKRAPTVRKSRSPGAGGG